MENSKKVRSVAKGKFTRIKKFIEAALSEGLSKPTVEGRYNDFDRVWRELQQRHEDYLMHLGSDDELEEAEHWIEIVSEEFYAVDNRVKVYLLN